LDWLSYVPAVRRDFLPVQDITGVDVIERAIAFVPEKGVPYDPRQLLAGYKDEMSGRWISGFFDAHSFNESLGGWAKTVVVGRARLGGIPVGCIMTENRTAENVIPADPADLESIEKVQQQAGGVWFPDSAYKTAQAIRDFNSEDLPLFIFANWRGFSGGQRDMFDEVLKFGAQIVDALVAFTQPVFVYIPPHGELRGGAWVVVDKTINENVMEMYASDNARGGVLEANGAAEIKFREKDYIATAHRLDATLQQLDMKLAREKDPNADISIRLTEQEREEIKQQIKKRENVLKTIYSQIAVQFADHHDTPGRMEAVGVIREMVPWEKARSYFYWRLRRRLAEFYVRNLIKAELGDQVSVLQCSETLKEWFVEDGKQTNEWEDDKMVLEWLGLESNTQRINALKYNRITESVKKFSEENSDAVVDGLMSAMQSLSAEEKEKILSKLR